MEDQLDWEATLAAEPPKGSGLTPERRAQINFTADEMRRKHTLKQQLEDRLKEVNQEINTLEHNTLPELMREAGVDRLGFETYDLKLSPYYHANIAANWSDERKQAAFDWLEENGHGDLLSVVVSVKFGKREIEQARKLQQQLVNQGHITAFAQNVPWQTFTAWAKEQYETYRNYLPDDLLGIQRGKIVKLSTRK